MKIVEIHEYVFPSHLLPTLINNDPIIDDRPVSSNGETEQSCFNDFIDRLDQLLKKYGASHYTIDYEPYSYFSHTNCLDLESCNVTDITVYFLRWLRKCQLK